MFEIDDPKQTQEIADRMVQLMAKDITPRQDLFPDLLDALVQVQPTVKNLDLKTLLVPRFAQNAMQRGLTNF